MDTEKILAVARKLHSMLPDGYKMSTGSHGNMLIDTPFHKRYSFQFYASFVMMDTDTSHDMILIDYDNIDESAEDLLDIITQ